jgi:microcystin-dependent protein
MAFEVVHSFVSEKADGLDSTVVQPSNWNDDHVLTMATGKVLGRMTAGTGAVEELPIFVDSTGQSMILPSGTTAERPAVPANGMQRYNTTLGQIEAYQNDAWGNLSDTAQAVMAEATVKGRATGAGTGAPQNLTKAQLQRLVYNVGNAYPTFNSTADDGFILPFGQNLNRTTYAALFAKWGTTYGVGDGSTTFGVPDVRGRTIAGKDDMGGTSANRLTGLTGGIDGDVLGGTGGSESHVLTLAQLAAHTHTGTTGNDSPDHTHATNAIASRGANGSGNRGWSSGDSIDGSANISSGGASARHTHTFTTASTGSDTAHNNVQPTIVANYQIYTGVHA